MTYVSMCLSLRQQMQKYNGGFLKEISMNCKVKLHIRDVERKTEN